MSRWLLVGALWSEAGPVIGALEGRRWLSPRLVEGALAGAEVAVLCCGVGQAAAERRTAKALGRWPAERVLSFGTCGALRGELEVGDVLTSAAVGDEAGARWPLEPLVGLSVEAAASVRAVVCTPTRRRALAEAGFGLCEMELAGVLAAAGSRRVHALKVVSDQAGADADPALPMTGLPSPVRLLRFQARAARLTHARLLPHLRATLSRQGEPN